MKYATIVYLVLFFIACNQPTPFEQKQDYIAKYLQEKGFSDINDFYISTDDIYNTQFELPRVKIFDSNGVMIMGGDCMNYLDELILNMGNRSGNFFPYKDSISLDEYLLKIKIVPIKNRKAKVNSGSKYHFTIFYNWISGMEFFMGKKAEMEIIETMKRSLILAERNKVKLYLIHIL